MAKTVTYVQEHEYDTQEDLQTAFSEAQSQTTEMRKTLRSTEQKLKEVNEQIHYTGQYLNLTIPNYCLCVFSASTSHIITKSLKKRLIKS